MHRVNRVAWHAVGRALGHAVGLPFDAMLSSLRTFAGLEHRCQWVRDLDGVSYYNDSKATNVNSTYYALESMTTPTVLILGGVDKGNDYSELFRLVEKKVKAIVAMGTDNHKIVEAFANGGRLVYLGAGTSGRLGILDAVECPPTYSVPATQVVALIAGGANAVYKAVEGAEDNADLAVADLNGDGVARGAFAASLAKTGARGVRMLHQHEGRSFIFGKPQARQFGFFGILRILKLVAACIAVINDGGVHAATEVFEIALKGSLRNLKLI
mgnify:CR=1 FL=1